MTLGIIPPENSNSDTPRTDSVMRRCNSWTNNPDQKHDLVGVSQEGIFLMINTLKEFEREINDLKKQAKESGRPIITATQTTHHELYCKCSKSLINNTSFKGFIGTWTNSDVLLEPIYKTYECVFCGRRLLFTCDMEKTPKLVGTWDYEKGYKKVAILDPLSCSDCEYKGESPISGDHCEGCANYSNHSKMSK